MKNLNRDELIGLVQRIQNNDFRTEEESYDAVELLQANLPDIDVIGEIFWSEPIEKDIDPVELVDRALALKSQNDSKEH